MTPYLLNGDKKDCCCCGMCAKICPVHAITLHEDEDGFLYPQIDENKCVLCKKCVGVCQYAHETPSLEYLKEPHCFACKNTNADVLQRSASGGLFLSIANSILERQGAVFGAAWQEDFRVSQEYVLEKDNLKKLQGSKYVFCDVNSSYFKVREFLDSGKSVLFTGTPCHISGLYAYLGHDYENLYTCDLICHGVPSYKYLHMFIDELNNSYKDKIVSINFKNKECGWRKPQIYIKFEKGKVYKQHLWNSCYGRLYHQRLTTMSSCNACIYATMPRKSDITMGDFWGYNEEKHELGTENMGISLAIINTKKGQRLFDVAKARLFVSEISLDDAMQLHLRESAKAPCQKKKEKFLQLNRDHALSTIADKINQKSMKETIIDVGQKIKHVFIKHAMFKRQ